jgi:hypothetical protein
MQVPRMEVNVGSSSALLSPDPNTLPTSPANGFREQHHNTRCMKSGKIHIRFSPPASMLLQVGQFLMELVAMQQDRGAGAGEVGGPPHSPASQLRAGFVDLAMPYRFYLG